MARKQLPPPQTPDLPPLDDEAIGETQVLAARMESAYRAGERERDRYVWQRIGRRESRELNTRMNQVADLMELQEFKAEKRYKGYLHTTEDGSEIEINSWEHYCLHIEGRSADAIDLDLGNLKIYGPQLYQMLTQQGIGPATLRKWRGLPEDGRAALQEAAETCDRAQLVELATELLELEQDRAADRQKQIERERDEAIENSGAKDGRINKLKEDIDKLQNDLSRATFRISALTAEENEMELRHFTLAIATDIESHITTRLRPAFEQLAGCTTVDHRRWMHDTARSLVALINNLAQEHNVDDPPDEIPAWADPEKFAAAEAEIVENLNAIAARNGFDPRGAAGN